METIKVWKKDEIANKIATDDKWLFRGIVAIYDRQTDDEKACGETKHHNNMGFSGCHANVLSGMAKRIKLKGSLTEKQIPWARKMMAHYSGQLTKIANGKL